MGLQATSKSFVLVLLGVVGMVFLAELYSPKSNHSDRLSDLGVVILPEPQEIHLNGLTTAGGDDFNLDSLAGHWSLIFFGFTNCPDICPITMAAMAAAERLLDEPSAFQGIMVTVDPRRDTPARLSKYVKGFSERFIGVTGAPERIRSFSTSLGISQAKKYTSATDYNVDHSGHIVIVNPRGQHGGYVKTPHSGDTIASAIKALRRRG